MHTRSRGALVALALVPVLTLAACGNDSISGNSEVDAQAEQDGVTVPKSELAMGETGVFLVTDRVNTGRIEVTVTEVAPAPDGLELGSAVQGEPHLIDYTIAAHDEAGTTLSDQYDPGIGFSLRDGNGDLKASPVLIAGSGIEACPRPDMTALEVGNPMTACAIVALEEGATMDAVSFRANAGDYAIYHPVYWVP